MSSTQGHTNINTVHTTLDISVLLGEINRIADDSYSKGFESGYDVGVKQGKADAVTEFVTRFEYENITDKNSERLNPIIYEMHRLAEQMQKER